VTFRAIKRAGRQRLHAAMSTPALYIPSRGATPVPCTVRVHTKFLDAGGLNKGDAERAEAEPKIIFLKSEVPAPRPQTGIVSVEPGEAYSIVAAEPADDITVTAKVTRMSAANANGLPTP
jgi:hypothetical protein